jgi:HD-GYP domain-containing protein (c-di-GMP phosphodiesterase class II)
MTSSAKPPKTQEIKQEHYLKAVTELGDVRPIVTACDIYSQTGIKLLAEGIHISSKLYDHLIHHKLIPDLDHALKMEGMLDFTQIQADVLELIANNDKLAKVAPALHQTALYQQLATNFPLPAPLAFKLTVAKEKFARIYKHSLLLMVLSVYLGRCDSLPLRDEEHLAIAALFHDIGLLHIDPAFLEPSHIMTSAERRHLYAHPLIAYLLLGEFPELPRTIADGVLEHHERMDGSGYPRGLHSENISRLGQILAVAELAAKAFDSADSKLPWKKLDVMLKLNSRKYGAGLIGHLNIFRENASDAHPNGQETAQLVEQVNLVAKLFDEFNHHSGPANRDTVFHFAQTRLAELQLSLFEAGFDPRNPNALIQMIMDDPSCTAEYAPLLGEAIWQFNSLVLEISRQWPEPAEKLEHESANSEHPWLREMKMVLFAAG